MTRRTMPLLTPSTWCVGLAVLFNALLLTPELISGVPSRNDSALHLLMVHGASDALAAGANPLDFWIPQLELGFPQFLYYQNLPHLLLVGVHRLLLGSVPLESLFHLSQYLLLCGLPITVAWSMRRMGFTPVAACVGALASTLLSADARYGFEYNSYLWRGIGLYTQLWGMHLSFVALAGLVVTLRDGRQHVSTALALAALALSHLVYAYLMAITSILVLLATGSRRTLGARTVHLVVAGVLSLAVAAYMLLPFLASSHAYLSNLPGLAERSHASISVIRNLVTGRLLDAGRLPVLTLLAAVGLVAALVRRGPARSLAAFGTIVWFVLYAGRPTMGALGGLLPSHSGFVAFRFIGALDLFVVLIIGVGGEWLWDRVARPTDGGTRRQAALAALLLAVLFAPAVVERAGYYRGNARLIAETQAALAADTDLTAILQLLDDEPGGRVYAGPQKGWGEVMTVGPSLRVADVLNARRRASIGFPYQGLALNSGLLFSFPDGNQSLYDAYDVRAVITPASAGVPPFFEAWANTGRYALHRVRTSGIAEYVAVTDRRSAMSQRELYAANSDWFTSPSPALREVVRWDYMAPVGPEAPRQPCPDGGRTLEESVESQRIRVVVDCPAASALALKMTYHPQWEVRVDGTPVDAYMVSPVFLGIDLPAGQHTVEAHYVANAAKLPLLIAGLVVLLVAARFRTRLGRLATRTD